MLMLKKTKVLGPENEIFDLYEFEFEDEEQEGTFHRFNKPSTISMDVGRFVGNGFEVKLTLVTKGLETKPVLTWTFGDGDTHQGNGYLVGESQDAIIKMTQEDTCAASLNIKFPAEFHEWVESLGKPKH